MMKLLIICQVIPILACSIHDQQPIKTDVQRVTPAIKTTLLPVDDAKPIPVSNDTGDILNVELPIEEEKTIDVDGNHLTVRWNGSLINVTKLPNLIRTPLSLKSFTKPLPLYNLAQLIDACQNMRYKTNAYQPITDISGSFVINPFTEIDIRAAFNRQMEPLVAERAVGALEPIKGSVEISAPYLRVDEIARLKNFLINQFFPSVTYIEFESTTSLEELENREAHQPIMELGRLICGLLDHEATFNFILTDNTQRSMTVIVDEVIFKN